MNIGAVALKINKYLKRQTGFYVYSLESKTIFWSGSQFFLKCDQPRGRKVADHPPKESQTQSEQEGGRKAMTMMVMMMMMKILMMLIVMCFVHP